MAADSPVAQAPRPRQAGHSFINYSTTLSPDATWVYRSSWTQGELQLAAAVANQHAASPEPFGQAGPRGRHGRAGPWPGSGEEPGSEPRPPPQRPLDLAAVLVTEGWDVSMEVLQYAEVATLSGEAAERLGFCEAEVFDLAAGMAFICHRQAVGQPWVVVGRATSGPEDLHEVLASSTPLTCWSAPGEAGHLMAVTLA
ncbi:hypothetical protein V8C86DRAFT_3089263 [Haematococcus lacustris]